MDSIGETDQFHQIAESFRLLQKPSMEVSSRGGGGGGGFSDAFGSARAQVLHSSTGQTLGQGIAVPQAFGSLGSVPLLHQNSRPPQQLMHNGLGPSRAGVIGLHPHHQNGLQSQSQAQAESQSQAHSQSQSHDHTQSQGQSQGHAQGLPGAGALPHTLFSGPNSGQSLSPAALPSNEVALRARGDEAASDKEAMEDRDSHSESLTRSESSLSVSVDPLHDLPVTSPGPPSVGHKRERELKSILSQMPEHPLRHRAGHRRTQSEVQVRGNYPSVAEHIDYGANPEAMAELANHEDGEALLSELMGFGAGGAVAAQLGIDFGRSSGGLESITAAAAARGSGGGTSSGPCLGMDMAQAAAAARARLDLLPNGAAAVSAGTSRGAPAMAALGPAMGATASEAPSPSSNNNNNNNPNLFQMGVGSHHSRSISVDENLLHNFHMGSSKEAASPGGGRRSRSQSFDEGGGQGAVNPELDAEGEEAVKKVLAGKKLTELEMIDPKRAKRILANRQSAARSKERKTRYILELEEKVTFYEQESVALKATLAILQREMRSLAKVNEGMNKKTQLLEKLYHQREAENKGLQDEMEILRQAAGQLAPLPLTPFSPPALPSASPSSPQLSLEQQLLALFQPQAPHQVVPSGSLQHQHHQHQLQSAFAPQAQGGRLQAQQGNLGANFASPATQQQQQQNQLLALHQALSQQQGSGLETMLNLHQGPYASDAVSSSVLGNPFHLVKNE